MIASSMIADLRFEKKCIECKERLATLKWSKAWQPGTDLCSRCWRLELVPTLGCDRDYYAEDRDE